MDMDTMGREILLPPELELPWGPQGAWASYYLPRPPAELVDAASRRNSPDRCRPGCATNVVYEGDPSSSSSSSSKAGLLLTMPANVASPARQPDARSPTGRGRPRGIWKWRYRCGDRWCTAGRWAGCPMPTGTSASLVGCGPLPRRGRRWGPRLGCGCQCRCRCGRGEGAKHESVT